MSECEISRILQRIREEEEAAKRGLNDYTIMSRHTFITTRVENIGRCFYALAKITGSKDAAMERIAADQNRVDGETNHVAL